MNVLPNMLSDRPAAVVGVVRALLILITAFWPNLFSPDQQAAILAMLIASIALTGVTIANTVPKTPSVDAPTGAIQTPPSN